MKFFVYKYISKIYIRAVPKTESPILMQLHYIHSNMCMAASFPLNNISVNGVLHIWEKGCLRFMGPKEEDGVLVGRRFNSSLWKLINLKDKGREIVYL